MMILSIYNIFKQKEPTCRYVHTYDKTKHEQKAYLCAHADNMYTYWVSNGKRNSIQLMPFDCYCYSVIAIWLVFLLQIKMCAHIIDIFLKCLIRVRAPAHLMSELCGMRVCVVAYLVLITTTNRYIYNLKKTHVEAATSACSI